MVLCLTVGTMPKFNGGTEPKNVTCKQNFTIDIWGKANREIDRQHLTVVYCFGAGALIQLEN